MSCLTIPCSILASELSSAAPYEAVPVRRAPAVGHLRHHVRQARSHCREREEGACRRPFHPRLRLACHRRLATGGMHGCFNSETMQVLGGREVVLFPDLKATEEWRRRQPMLESFCRRATCSDMLKRIATGAQRETGLDIADFLLMKDTPQMILQQMIARNPVLQSLIDAFGLELVDAGRVE